MDLPAKLDRPPATSGGVRVSVASSLCALLVVGLAVATYLPWVNNYLVADSWTVIDAVSRPNLTLADLLPFRDAPLMTSATYYYAPVLAAWLWGLFKLSGYSPALYHVAILLLHAGTTLFLYIAVLQLSHSRLKATFAGALFAVHFASTEAVGWFGAVSHPTAGFFGMAGLALYARFLVTRGRVWWVMALAALTASAFTQSTGLPWFLVVAVLDAAYSWRSGQKRALAWRLLLLALPLIIILPPQTQAFRFAKGGYHYAVGPWVVLNLFYYPLSTVVPSLEQSAFSLARDLQLAPADYGAFTRLAGMTGAFDLLLGAGLVLIAAVLLWFRGSWLTRFALVGFVISLTPFLLINGQGYRYLYAPLIFFSMAVADAVVDLARSLRASSRPAALAIVLAVPLFVTLSFVEAERQMFWWQQAGYVAHQSLTELKTLQPQFPAGSKVIFGGLPDTLQNTNAEIWRQGITEAVRTIYGDRTLRVEAYGKSEVERMFREELKDAPATYGFVWEDWHFRSLRR